MINLNFIYFYHELLDAISEDEKSVSENDDSEDDSNDNSLFNQDESSDLEISSISGSDTSVGDEEEPKMDGGGKTSRCLDVTSKSFEREAKDYIHNNEIIMKLIFKKCCDKMCLRRISPGFENLNFAPCLEFVKKIRTKIIGNPKQDRLSLMKFYIFNSMNASSSTTEKGNGERRMRVHFPYLVEDYSFCSTAFENLFGISSYMRKKLVQEVKEGMLINVSSRIYSDRSSAVSSEQAKELLKVIEQLDVQPSQSFKTNLTLPNSPEIGFVR